MPASAVISFSGPEQKTPSNQGNWKIFINKELAKSRFWPKDLSHTCDDEKNVYIICSKQYYLMNSKDMADLSKLLTTNGFESMGDVPHLPFDLAQMTFQDAQRTKTRHHSITAMMRRIRRRRIRRRLKGLPFTEYVCSTLSS